MSENPNLDENGHWIGTGKEEPPPPAVLDERGDWAGAGPVSKPPVMILDENGGFIGTYEDFAPTEPAKPKPKPKARQVADPAPAEDDA